MTDIRVLDRDTRRTVAILSGGGHRPDYLSLEVVERLYGPDDLTLTLDARRAKAAGLTGTEQVTIDGEQHWQLKPKLLVLSDDSVYAVSHVEVESSENRQVSRVATVVAVDPVALPRRIVPDGAATDTQSGPAETALLNLIGNYLGPSANRPGLVVPDLALGPDLERGRSSEWRPRFQPLVEFLGIVAQDGGIGWRSRWDPEVGGDDPGRVVVEARVGEVRQVAVSVEDGTLTSERMAVSDDERRNYVYVAGDGEGVSRLIVERHLGSQEPTGYRRRETLEDAGNEDSISELEARGDGRLRETLEAGPVQATLAERRDFRYGTHWNLGDLLPYRSEFRDESELLRVTQVTSRFTDSLVPTRSAVLGVPFPDPDERDERRRGGQEFR